MSEAVVLTIGSGFVTALIWLLRLEGRVNGHDGQHKEHAKRHEEMRDDLSYIRERIDRALNGRH